MLDEMNVIFCLVELRHVRRKHDTGHFALSFSVFLSAVSRDTAADYVLGSVCLSVSLCV